MKVYIKFNVSDQLQSNLVRVREGQRKKNKIMIEETKD